MGEAPRRRLKNPPRRHVGRAWPASTSTEPATGATLWTGEAGDVDAEVAPRAPPGPAGRRAASPSGSRPCAASPMSCAAEVEPFADLIARETGKPLWETRTEVEAVINKVDISVAAYADRTAQRRLEGAMGAAGRRPPQAARRARACSAPIISRRICPTATSSRPCSPAMRSSSSRARRRRRSANIWSRSITRRACPRASVTCVQGGPETGKALAAQPGLDGLLFTGSARAGLALHRQFAETPHKILALEMGGNNPLVDLGRARHPRRRRDRRPVRLS